VFLLLAVVIHPAIQQAVLFPTVQIPVPIQLAVLYQAAVLCQAVSQCRVVQQSATPQVQIQVFQMRLCYRKPTTRLIQC
jgi:hypothetical protein